MTRILALALVVAVHASARADIGPKPLDYAGHPTPLHDMKGVDVEMASEDVRLVLSKAKLEVDATFAMVNHGGDVTFEEGFPVGPYKTMTGFSVTMDGKPAPFRLVDRAEADRGKKPADYWYVWNATFKAGARHEHRVRYTVGLDHQHFYHQTGYVLHTGAAWKNAIGKAVVTLTFGEGASIDHLRRVSPAGRFESGRVVWTFENLEPGKEHDIVLRYDTRRWQDEIADLRKRAPGRWYDRRTLAAVLQQVPACQGRRTFTPSELKGYLDALGALIAEEKVVDGRHVIPGTDPDPFEGRRSRYYVLESSPADIFGGLMGEALAAARDYPAEAAPKPVLKAYRDFVARILAGQVHVDMGGRIVPAKAPTPQQRKSLEDRIAEADRLLAS